MVKNIYSDRNFIENLRGILDKYENGCVDSLSINGGDPSSKLLELNIKFKNTLDDQSEGILCSKISDLIDETLNADIVGVSLSYKEINFTLRTND
jgi:hypothetical protein